MNGSLYILLLRRFLMTSDRSITFCSGTRSTSAQVPATQFLRKYAGNTSCRHPTWSSVLSASSAYMLSLSRERTFPVPMPRFVPATRKLQLERERLRYLSLALLATSAKETHASDGSTLRLSSRDTIATSYASRASRVQLQLLYASRVS